jgi:hypothetical protein
LQRIFRPVINLSEQEVTVADIMLALHQRVAESGLGTLPPLDLISKRTHPVNAATLITRRFRSLVELSRLPAYLR